MALKGSYMYGYRQRTMYDIESKLAPKSNVVFQNSDHLSSFYSAIVMSMA